jgi:hypothetical protein
VRQCIPCHCVNIFLSSLELLIGDNLDIPPRHAVALKGAASRTKAADAACPSSLRRHAVALKGAASRTKAADAACQFSPCGHAVALKGSASRTKAADAACQFSPRRRASPRVAEGFTPTAH